MITDSEFRIPQAFETEIDGEFAPPDTRGQRLAMRKLVHVAGRRFGKPVPRHVYFIGSDYYPGVLKIGSAFDIELRLRQIQACSPVPLRLFGWIKVGGAALESTLHRHFAARRSHGEWFRVTIGGIRWALGDRYEIVIEVAP